MVAGPTPSVRAICRFEMAEAKAAGLVAGGAG
jgi:hypothetical protein